MDAPQATFDLFRPFDGDVPGEAIERASNSPTRGITWVLVRATAGVVLALAIVTLAKFAHCLAAELSLARAAKAAALEATLPRASYETVCSAVKSRLAHNTDLSNKVEVSLMQNGATFGRAYQPKPGDRITVTLTVPKSVAQPYWLRALKVSSIDKPITVRAEGCIPGKQFPASVARWLMSAR